MLDPLLFVIQIPLGIHAKIKAPERLLAPLFHVGLHVPRVCFKRVFHGYASRGCFMGILHGLKGKVLTECSEPGCAFYDWNM